MRKYLAKGYAEDDLSTWMQDAGYRTMMVGKFLHHDSAFVIPPGWDDFYSSLGARYFETFRITNRGGAGPQAETLPPGVYRTTAESVDATGLIIDHVESGRDKPFFMFLNPYGPHRQQRGSGEMFEDNYATLWPDATVPLSPAYDEEDLSDLNGPLKLFERLSEWQHDYMNEHYRERLKAMKSVDDMIADIVAVVESNGLADNTYIFVTSDNGFSLGHHRTISKGFTCNRTSNVPLIVAGPGISPAVSHHLLAHIDIGPTIVSLAGGQIPDFVDGVSFASLLANPNQSGGVRDHVLIENFESRTLFGIQRQIASTSLRLTDGLYNEWASGGREYFDLNADPEQLENIYPSLDASTRRSLASTIRSAKSPMPSTASFQTPYTHGEILPFPYEISGIAESSSSMRRVAMAVRDLSNGRFWDGENWVVGFRQVDATIAHRNAVLTNWKLPLNFDSDERPSGLIGAWVWGLDNSNRYDAPQSVVFRLESTAANVTLVQPLFSQRYNGAVRINGVAASGSDRILRSVELKIRNADTGKFWNGNTMVSNRIVLPVLKNGDVWSYETDSLPSGRYRASVNGIDSKGQSFAITHRLFFKD
jgi:arylsulfatase A-like enzyme